MDEREFWHFIAGVWVGGIASVLGMLTHDWRRHRREKRRLIEEAARIQARDGVTTWQDGLRLHVERERRGGGGE